MLVNVLVVMFVTGFVAIAALGHALLITAVWPDLFRFKRQPNLGTVAGAHQHLHHSK